MAVQKYRYRRSAPISQSKLRSVVGSSATIDAAGGETIVDITIDDATQNVTDLDAAMASLGWTNIATNPSNTPQDAVTATRSIYTTNGPTSLTAGSIADGQMIVRSGTEYVGQAVPTAGLPSAFIGAAKFLRTDTADWAVNGAAS